VFSERFKEAKLGLVNASATVLMMPLKRLNSVFMRSIHGFVSLFVLAGPAKGIKILQVGSISFKISEVF